MLHGGVVLLCMRLFGGACCKSVAFWGLDDGIQGRFHSSLLLYLYISFPVFDILADTAVDRLHNSGLTNAKLRVMVYNCSCRYHRTDLIYDGP